MITSAFAVRLVAWLGASLATALLVAPYDVARVAGFGLI
jgi:hypothetical protein